MSQAGNERAFWDQVAETEPVAENDQALRDNSSLWDEASKLSDKIGAHDKLDRVKWQQAIAASREGNLCMGLTLMSEIMKQYYAETHDPDVKDFFSK